MAVRQQSLILPERELCLTPEPTVPLLQHARRPRLWLALRLPQLPVEVFPAAAGQALAVVANGTGGSGLQSKLREHSTGLPMGELIVACLSPVFL